MADHEIERVQIPMFTDDQMDLLRLYLRGAQIPYEMTHDSVTVPAERSRDLYAVLEKVARERADAPVQPIDRTEAVAERPIVTGGYRVATRNRRAVGAVIDWVVLNAWTVLAHRSGSPSWAIVGTLGLYTIASVSLMGRTLGKFAAGTLVIDAQTGRPPNWLNSAIRWLMVSWFSVIAIFVISVPVVVVVIASVLVVTTYTPILWDLRGRGWHDRFANTLVVRARR